MAADMLLLGSVAIPPFPPFPKLLPENLSGSFGMSLVLAKLLLHKMIMIVMKMIVSRGRGGWGLDSLPGSLPPHCQWREARRIFDCQSLRLGQWDPQIWKRRPSAQQRGLCSRRS